MNKKAIVIGALLVLPWLILAGVKAVHRHHAKAPVAITQPVVIPAPVSIPAPTAKELCTLAAPKPAPKYTVQQVKRVTKRRPIVKATPVAAPATCPFLFWDRPCP